MNWLKTVIVAGSVCGVLPGGVTSSAFAAEDGHIKEVIKHAKEGITHEKETIKHLEEALKVGENPHAKESLKHAEGLWYTLKRPITRRKRSKAPNPPSSWWSTRTAITFQRRDPAFEKKASRLELKRNARRHEGMTERMLS